MESIIIGDYRLSTYDRTKYVVEKDGVTVDDRTPYQEWKHVASFSTGKEAVEYLLKRLG